MANFIIANIPILTVSPCVTQFHSVSQCLIVVSSFLTVSQGFCEFFLESHSFQETIVDSIFSCRMKRVDQFYIPFAFHYRGDCCNRSPVLLRAIKYQCSNETK